MSRKSFQSAASRAGGEPIPFDVDDDTFYALPAMPGMSTLDMAAMADQGTKAERAKAIMGVLDSVLLPESAVRFAHRMRGRRPRRPDEVTEEHPEDEPVMLMPITVEDASAIVRWLVTEVYHVGRPTEGPSLSQPGSLQPGTPSTDGAPPVESTPSPSPQIGS